MSFKRIIPLIFVLIFNLWIWRIFNFNFFIGLVVVSSSILLFLSIITSKKTYFFLSLASFSILFFLEWKTSFKNSLTFLNENEIRLQQIRMNGYPPFSIKIGRKTIWIPTANWLEKRNEIIVFYKLQNNLSEIVDPNLYFFANHPRERVGVVEFEKFPYILLPFFILGIFTLKKKNIKEVILSLSPIMLISIIGNSNPIGPFSLFPFITVFTSLGISQVNFKNKKLLIFTLILFFLVFIQIFAYAKY